VIPRGHAHIAQLGELERDRLDLYLSVTPAE
jgi:hypothetical protein